MATKAIFRAKRLALVTLKAGFSQRHASTVGFIGLGNMGAHMARNLIKNGHSLIVHDVVESSVKSLQEAGATIAQSPAEVAKQVTCVVTMLPSSPQVQQVYAADDGIFSSVQTGSLLLDCSTIDPGVSRRMAQLAGDKQAQYMDAPVSGGVNAARDAVLTFMVGGPRDKFETAKKLLSYMGKNIIHCGPIGNGQAAKICNNMLLGISMIGTSETMSLGMKLGLDADVLAGIINTSSGRCWSSEVYNPVPGVVPGVPSSNDYQGGFGTALMTKDLGLAQDAATSHQCPTPMGSAAHQLYRLMCNSGYGGKDFSVAYRFLQEQSKKS